MQMALKLALAENGIKVMKKREEWKYIVIIDGFYFSF